MADNTATFAIELETKGNAGAEELASSLQDLQGKIKADTAALREMQAALKSLQGGASVDVAAFKQLRDGIKAKQASIAQANSDFIKLGGTFGKTASGAAAAEGDIGGLLGAIKSGGGPMGGMLEKVQSLSGAIGKIGLGKAVAVAALAAMAVAVVAVTAALIAGVVALTQYALGVADAARSQRMLLGAAVGGAAGLAGVTKTIDSLSAQLPSTRAELEALAKKLADTGLKGKALDDALRKAAFDDAKKKFGDIKGAMISLPVQMAKVKENLARLFGDIKIEPFLKALASVLSLFDQSTSSGRALKQMAESMLNPIFSALAALEPLAKGFFKGLIIGALLITIAFLKVKNALKDAFGDMGGIDLMKVGVYAGVAAIMLLVAAFVIVGAAIAAAVSLFVLPFAVIAAAIYGLVAGFMAAYDAIAGINFGELGSSIVQGIVDGITAGVGWVVDAMKSMASSAIGAFKGALGISSPSKAMRVQGGRPVGQGLVQGVKDTQPQVDAAMDRLVTPPSASAQAAAGAGSVAGAGGGGGSRTYHITVAAGSPDEMKSEPFWIRVSRLLEDAAESASPEPEPA